MKPVPLQNQFNNGMKRDMARNRMPPNSVWNAIDYVWDYGAPARERAGWAYASSDMDAITATSTYVRGGIYATFSPTAGAQDVNLAIDEDGYVFKVALSGTPAATGVGAGVPIAQNPVFHGGTAVTAATAVYTGLVIIPDGTGAAVPKKYDGTTLSNLNGSPPKARYATVYKDYTALANGTVGSINYPNRVWWGPAGDPDCGFSGAVTAWDTTDAWNDFSLPIIGLASTKNVMLVFHDGSISRIRGNTPPPEEDMVVDDPWQKLTLLDPFSITEYSDQIYFCAAEGVFRTDGVTMDDITLKGGMLRYWLDLMQSAAGATSWTFSTGVIRNKLIISVMDGATFKDAFIIDLQSYAWGRLSNIKATSFWTGQYGNADETYFGSRSVTSEVRVGRLNTMFDVDVSTYKADADGVPVTSTLETPFLELGRPGIKTIKGLHVGYYLKDHDAGLANVYKDVPTVEVTYVTTPEATAYKGGNLLFDGGFTSQITPNATGGNGSGWVLVDGPVTVDNGIGVSPGNASDAYGRCFTASSTAKGTINSDEFIPIDITKPYCLSHYVAQWQQYGVVDPNGTIRLTCYDKNKTELGFVYPNEAAPGVNYDSGHAITYSAASAFSRWGGVFRGSAGVTGTNVGGFPAGTAFVKIQILLQYTATSFSNGIGVIVDAVEFVQGDRPLDRDATMGYGPFTLPANTQYNRVRVPIGGRAYGLGLKFVKSGPGDFHGFDISAEVGFQEESKRMT